MVWAHAKGFFFNYYFLCFSLFFHFWDVDIYACNFHFMLMHHPRQVHCLPSQADVHVFMDAQSSFGAVLDRCASFHLDVAGFGVITPQTRWPWWGVGACSQQVSLKVLVFCSVAGLWFHVQHGLLRGKDQSDVRVLVGSAHGGMEEENNESLCFHYYMPERSQVLHKLLQCLILMCSAADSVQGRREKPFALVCAGGTQQPYPRARFSCVGYK